jgi:hypothetical protein
MMLCTSGSSITGSTFQQSFLKVVKLLFCERNTRSPIAQVLALMDHPLRVTVWMAQVCTPNLAYVECLLAA